MKNYRLTNRKYLFITLCILVIIIACLSKIYINRNDAYAQATTVVSPETMEEKCERFTSDERLPNDNTRTIFDVICEIKQLNDRGRVNDLEQVIPIEYLRDQGENVVYKYFGIRYGFIVIHEIHEIEKYDHELNKDNIEVIEYTYISIYDIKNELENGESKIEIEGLLSICIDYHNFDEEYWDIDSGFYYVVNAGGGVDTYDFRKDIYLKNVSFNELFLNEQELNYGDIGYSKNNDNGLIIRQTRVNYREVKRKTDINMSDAIKFTLDCTLGILPIPYMDELYNLLSLGYDFYSIVSERYQREYSLNCDNELNINTHLSREEQLNNEDYDTFIRVSCLRPSEEIYIGQDGYASFVTMLDDSNAMMRLIQQLTFNISLISYNGVETIYSNANETIQIEETIFEDQAIVETLPNQIGGEVDLYMLWGGKRKVEFTPQLTGKYDFDIDNCAVKVMQNGVKLSYNNGYELTAGIKYDIEVTNQKAATSTIATLTFEFLNKINLGQSSQISLAANDQKTFLINSNEKGYFQFTLSNSNITVVSGATSMGNGKYYIYREPDETQYIIFANNSLSSITCNFTPLAIESLNIYDTQEVGVTDDKIYKFTNPSTTADTFELHLTWQTDSNNSVDIRDIDKTNLSYTSIATSNTIKYIFSLDKNESCYIIYNISDITNTTLVFKDDTISWRVDDAILNSDSCLLGRGSTYTIEQVVVGEQGYISVSSNLIESDYKGYATLGINSVTIVNDADLGGYFSLKTAAYPENILYIEKLHEVRYIL